MRSESSIQAYREVDRDLAYFLRDMYQQKGDKPKIFIPYKELKSDLVAQLDTLSRRIGALPTDDPVFDIMSGHYGDFLDNLRVIVDSEYEKPANYVSSVLNTFYGFVRNDSRPDDVKAELLIMFYSKTDDVWQALKTWLSEVSPLYLQAFVGSCAHAIDTLKVEATRLLQYFPTLPEKRISDIEYSIKTVVVQLEAWQKFANEIIAKKGLPETTGTTDDDTVALDPEYYKKILWNNVGVSLDEILSWYEDEMNKTREEVYSIVGKLNITDPFPKNMNEVNDILLKYAGPCDTPEEMFKRADAYIARSKAGCKDYVWLPEEECLVGKVPESLKYSYPWGGYGGGCARRRPLKGLMFLNDFNFKAVTDGWIKMNTIHESYPGHHVQFVRTTVDPLPETVKMGAKSTTITEGTPHRSERVFEFVFEEDPFFPLFVAYRRHHTSTRIKVDLTMRYFGKPIRDAVAIYQEELGFDRKTARGQVQAQENMMGYFTSYYYGMKKLCDWEKQFGFGEKEYTELLFAAGRISLENFEKFLKLTPEDRNSYLKDFSSIAEKDWFARY